MLSVPFRQLYLHLLVGSSISLLPISECITKYFDSVHKYEQFSFVGVFVQRSVWSTRLIDQKFSNVSNCGHNLSIVFECFYLNTTKNFATDVN